MAAQGAGRVRTPEVMNRARLQTLQTEKNCACNPIIGPSHRMFRLQGRLHQRRTLKGLEQGSHGLPPDSALEVLQAWSPLDWRVQET